MKRHDTIKSLVYDSAITNNGLLTYSLTIKNVDRDLSLTMRHIPYKDLRRAIKVFGKSYRHIEAICELTGEIIYSKYESYRTHDDKRHERLIQKFLNKYYYN